jgi:hypothetical protein
MTLYEDEVQLAPGIYLTKKKSVQEQHHDSLKKTLEQMSDNPKVHLEFLQEQIRRTKKAIEQLDYSNKAMHEADPTDPVYIEAIAENLVIIERQQLFIDDLKAKATQVASVLGVCLQEEFTVKKGDKTIEIADDGVYL